jgi:uncharacterized membrane protein YkvI
MQDKNWIKIASIYVGTVIGAGFASGQEIMQFFGAYGYMGVFGIITASILFSGIGAVILVVVYNNKIKGYEELLTPIFGTEVGRLIEIIITLFLFISYCVMLAGSGAIFYEQLNLPFVLGVYIMAVLTLITFFFDIKGISLVNVLIVPLLIVGIISIGTMIILKEGFLFSNFHGAHITKTGNWFTSTLLYVSYNSISAMVIMTTLLPIIPNRGSALKGGVFGGLILGLLAMFVLIPTLILYTDLYRVEIPMLKIAEGLGELGKFSYSLILWGAMFTTAIASGYGCIGRISSLLGLNKKLVAIVFCTITIPLAKIGFSKLVSTMYPILGYVGFIILFFVTGNIMLRYIKR